MKIPPSQHSILNNFLCLLKHSFNIIGISEHKINKKLICLVMHSLITKLKASIEEQFFVSHKLTFKQRPDLVINEAGKLESTFIELILPNKRNVVCRNVNKHGIMETKFFNDEYVTPVLSTINK